MIDDQTPAHGLACPPEIAQWLHDRVVQRVVGVAAALGTHGPIEKADQTRCRAELEAALGALRLLLNGHVERAPRVGCRTLAQTVRFACGASGAGAVELCLRGDARISSATAQFVADFVVEVLRNVAKHAHARRVVLTVAAQADTVSIVAFNDGVASTPGGVGTGVGLRLLAARALDHGGSVATGATEGDGWSTMLTLRRRACDGPTAPRIGRPGT